MSCTNCACRVYPSVSLDSLNHKHTYEIMVIGESPTAAEASRGVLMTGPGGQVLRKTMQAVGLPVGPDKVYYTTAVKCAVPKKKGQKFPKEAIKNCRSTLLEEINRVQPKLILVCGSIALSALTGSDTLKITEEYGRVREYPFLPEGVKVIPIMNPGVLLHKPGDYKPFLTMLQLAATIFSGGDTVDTGETRWTVCDTPEKCHDLWNRMVAEKVEWCAMDIETTGLDYRVVEFLVLGICFERNHTYIITREVQHLVHNFLSGPWKTIWQHGKYDKKVMWRRKLGTVSIDADTMYQHYVLDETSAHDLGYLSKVFLNAEEYKYKMNQDWKSVTLESYPKFRDALCERAAVDCDYALQLFHKFNDLLAQPGNEKLKVLYEDFLIPAANFLARVEQNGILIDEKYLNGLDEKYTKLLVETTKEIERLAAPFWDPEEYKRQSGARTAPVTFNPGSPKQMSWMVFDRLKLRPRIKKGKSTAKEILDSIEKAPPLIKKVREYRTIQKEHSTYVIGLLDARDDDGKVRSTFNLHVTATGRLSSKEPNIQNQPAANGLGNVRKAFIAEPGYLLAEIDYSGAELRWLAFLSSCPVLGEVFKQGRNLHDETSKALFGEHYTKKQKMRAKAINFGIPYGISAPTIADEHNITTAEAQDMIDGWNRLYYGAAAYLQWCADQVSEGKYLETAFGRRRRFGLVSPTSLNALQNEAKNFPIQSSSSDLLLDCSILLEEPLIRKYNTQILNLIHDSILLHIPAKREVLMAVGKLANEVMTSRPKDRFNCPIPFKTDFEIGLNWGELEVFNCRTGMVEIEKDDIVTEMDFDVWYTKQLERQGNN